MIFNWIEKEVSEGDLWSIFPPSILPLNEDVCIFGQTEIHLNHHLNHESILENPSLQRESYNLQDADPDSALM